MIKPTDREIDRMARAIFGSSATQGAHNHTFMVTAHREAAKRAIKHANAEHSKHLNAIKKKMV